MPRRKRGESLEDFRARDAEYHRTRRERKRNAQLAKGAPAVGPEPRQPNAPAERMLRPVNGIEPILRVFHRLNGMLDSADQTEKPLNAREFFFLSKSARELATGLRYLQLMATADDIQRIVELVDPHLPEHAREQLQGMLAEMARRVGLQG